MRVRACMPQAATYADSMQRPPNDSILAKLFGPWPAFPATVAAFLAMAFLYVWLRVEPVLEYHSHGPFFRWQKAYFESFLNQPGWLANYAASLVAQMNAINWLGALAFALSAGAAVLLTALCLKRISGRTAGWLALAPLFALLLVRNRYDFPGTALSFGFLTALFAATVFVWLPWRKPPLAVVLSAALSVGVFWLAGAWAALLFGILTGLYAGFQLGCWYAAASCTGFALVAPVFCYVTGRVKRDWLLNPWPGEMSWPLALVLFACVPVAALLVGWLARVAARQAAETGGPAPRAADDPAERHLRAMVVLFCVLGWALVWAVLDPREKRLAEIDYYTYVGQYEKAVAAAQRVKVLTYPAEVRLHLALYHTGRLAEDLFTFQNIADTPPLEGLAAAFRAQSQPLLELGLVNDAEHSAHEALEMEGCRPDLLRLLARVNRLKGRPQAAQVFLNVLSRMPFQGEQPEAAWPLLPTAPSTAELNYLRGLFPLGLTNDMLHTSLPLQELLQLALVTNPTNRMAFEYLMANYLMDLNLKSAMPCLEFLNNFPYERIPRAYEEAILLFQQFSGMQVEVRGKQVRPATAERFRQFQDAVRRMNGKPENQLAIAEEFGDTYWYFYGVRTLQRSQDRQAQSKK